MQVQDLTLLYDLESRYKRKVEPAFWPDDKKLVLDLLTPRPKTDKMNTPGNRRIIVDPATGEGMLRVATYFPGPGGNYKLGASSQRYWLIDVQYPVVAALVAELKDGGLIVHKNDGTGPNDYAINLTNPGYEAFRNEYPDLEYVELDRAARRTAARVGGSP
ncbi:MAG: hypothetical protein V4474_01615 [Patescibacteria group bacterium]